MELLKFEKPGCGPCGMVQNHLDAQGVKATRIDAFENPEQAAKYEIGSLPTLVLVDENGEEIERTFGFKPPEIDALIEKDEMIRKGT